MEQQHFIADAILDAMRDGVLTLDMTGKIAFCNPAAAELFGTSPEDLLGCPFHEIALETAPVAAEEGDDLAAPGNEDLMQVLLDAIYEQQTIRNRVIHLALAGAPPRSLSVSATHLRDEEGQLTGAVLVLADITEMERLHQAEQELNNELKNALRQIDDSNRELKSALKKGQRIRLMATTAVILIFLSLGVYLWNGSLPVSLSGSEDGLPFQPQSADSGTLATITVTPRPLGRSISLAGTVAPLEEVSVSAPFQAAVQKKNFFYGQRVKRGDVLLSLDTSDIRLKLREARAVLIKARKKLKELENWTSGPEVSKARRELVQTRGKLQRANQTLEENKVLFEKGIIPQTEYDNSRHSFDDMKMQLISVEENLESILGKGDRENMEIARMELANAESNYQELEQKVSRAQVRAPVSGIAIRPTAENTKKESGEVEQGMTVQEGQSLLSVASLEGLSITAKVDELDINNLKVGQRVQVSGDAFPGITLNGEVAHISSQALTDGGKVPMFEALIRLRDLPENLSRTVRLGMSARMIVSIYNNPKALTVPLSAVHRIQGKTLVKVVRPDGSVRNVNVLTGYTTFDSVEILDGLQAGDKIVVPGDTGVAGSGSTSSSSRR